MTSLDLQPHLTGLLLELRPLRPDDWEDLYRVASDPLIWEQHPARTRFEEPVFREFFRDALASGGALVAINRSTGQTIGSSRYFWHGPGESELEIGWSFLAREYWGGQWNGEMKRLMLQHAFRSVDHVIFLVGENNLRSQKALRKIGARLTERRVTRGTSGATADSVVFEITPEALV